MTTMFNGVSEGFRAFGEATRSGLNTTRDAFEKAWDTTVNGIVLGKPTWFSKQVIDWSQATFSPETAKVVAAAIVALPLIALSFLTPPVISSSIQIVCIIGRVCYIFFCDPPQDDYFSRGTDDPTPLNWTAYMNNLAFLATWTGVRRIADGFFRNDLPMRINGTGLMVLAVFHLLNSNFLGDSVRMVTELLQTEVEQPAEGDEAEEIVLE